MFSISAETGPSLSPFAVHGETYLDYWDRYLACVPQFALFYLVVPRAWGINREDWIYISPKEEREVTQNAEKKKRKKETIPQNTLSWRCQPTEERNGVAVLHSGSQRRRWGECQQQAWQAPRRHEAGWSGPRRVTRWAGQTCKLLPPSEHTKPVKACTALSSTGHGSEIRSVIACCAFFAFISFPDGKFQVNKKWLLFLGCIVCSFINPPSQVGRRTD